jgi:DNA-binding MarR family transcriptional regulator
MLVDRDQRRVLEVLESRRLMAVDIQRQTGLDTGAVTSLLLALQGRGFVSWDVDADRGVWMLTTSGQEAIGAS